MGRWVVVLGLAAAAPGGGCSFGPKAIEKTHGRYAAAVERVEVEQLLDNVVRLRYLETPHALRVSAIAAQYELAAGAEARPFFNSQAARVANPAGNLYDTFTSILPFGTVSGATRPTVSMTPDDDASSVRQYLTPITADTLVFLGQSGWPVADVLRVWVDRLNGVPNWAPPAGPPRDVPADYDRFRRACDLLQAAQDRELMSVHAEDRATAVGGPVPAGAITAAAVVEAAKEGFEYHPRGDGATWELVKRQKRLVLQVNPAGRGSPELAELEDILNMTPGRDRYELEVASGVPDPLKNPGPPADALRVTPRSTAQALFYLANGVEVPAAHRAAGLVREVPGVDPGAATAGVFRVRSCEGHKHRPPADAYAAVWYRGHWFWVDDRDADTKATFFLVLQLRRLDFRRQQIGGVPALTLPVGR
ncbi:MAG: hypothetical protein K2X82_15045 [Gemmataceae bacterium]|nr:hypothetical protein [Gemmataceae bacterium]